MKSILNHPASILAALGAASGLLGTFALGFGIGEAPRPGIYMILAGLWFALVTGYGVLTWGGRSWRAAAIAFAGTCIAWQAAVNLALQLDSNWLKESAIPVSQRMLVSGFLAGALGAFLTWAATAYAVPRLRCMTNAVAIAVAGAVLGLLLPLTNTYDNPAVLLLPWQAGVAAMFGFVLSRWPGSEATPLPPSAMPLRAAQR